MAGKAKAVHIGKVACTHNCWQDPDAPGTGEDPNFAQTSDAQIPRQLTRSWSKGEMHRRRFRAGMIQRVQRNVPIPKALLSGSEMLNRYRSDLICLFGMHFVHEQAIRRTC